MSQLVNNWLKNSARVGEHYIDFALSRLICLILYSILIVPSVSLAIFVFYCIFRMPELRNRLTNHLIIAIFVVCFIQTTCELPLLMKYLTDGHVAFDSYDYCKIWIAFNYSLNTTILFLTALLSIERYLLIFHGNTLHRFKIFMHYIPMLGVTVVAIGYSCSTVLFSGCTEAFDYNNQLCGGPCFQIQPILGTFDLIFTIFIPLGLIIFFNGLLVFRVIYQKRRLLQRDIWKKNIRMLAQLLTVSILHFVVWMPIVIVILIAIANYPPPAIIIDLQASFVLLNLAYVAVLGNPIVSIFAIPEIKTKVDALFSRLRHKVCGGQIEPLAAPASRTGLAVPQSLHRADSGR